MKSVKKTLFRIIVFILMLVSALYFIQKAYEKFKYEQNKVAKVNFYYNKKNTENKSEATNSYIMINKDCLGCISNRKGNAGCLITKDNKVLLVKYRRTNQISLPGGFRDYVQSDTVVASEEMRNAVGYIVSIEDIISDFNYHFSLSEDSNFRLYKCNIIKETEPTNNKILEKIWVDKKTLYDILHKSNKDVAFKNELQFVYDKFEYFLRI